jgi:hypothetical protein
MWQCLIWALDGSKYSDSRPGRLTLTDRTTGTYFVKILVGPQDLEAVVSEIILPSPGMEPWVLGRVPTV